MPRIHLVNPSVTAFGTAVITPRWLYVLAGATPAQYGDPVLVDETLEPLRPVRPSTRAMSSASASTPPTPCAGYEVGRAARERGAYVVFGGIHATLYPDEARGTRRRTRGRDR